MIKVNGEPDYVTKTRELILETFKDLVFVEEGHKYYLQGKELPSVSSVTHKYLPPFDEKKMSESYAKKHGQTPEFWRDQWKYKNLISTTAGTEVHAFGECMTYLRMGHPELIPEEMRKFYITDKGWLIPTRSKEESIIKYFSEMYLYDYPVLAETKVFNNFNPSIPKMKTDYCGTFDILYYRYFPDNPENSGYVIKDYKGLPINTPIATKDGWKRMIEIEVGDEVFDKDGGVCKVTGVSSLHLNPCYKITLEDGEVIVADEEHRWYIGGKIKTTKELREGDRIPLAQPLNLPDIDLGNEDPYEIGKNIALRKIAPKKELLRAGKRQRRYIFQGFSENIKERTSVELGYRYFKVPYIDFFLELTCGLGFKVSNDKDDVVVQFPELAVYDSESWAKSWNIIKIEPTEPTDTVETKCIEVDSPSHTYCFGKKMYVTHNTNKELTKTYSREHHRTCLEPFTELIDEPLSMYTLQLSCYQIPLMDLGIKIIDREIIWLKDDRTYEVISLPDYTQKIREVL